MLRAFRKTTAAVIAVAFAGILAGNVMADAIYDCYDFDGKTGTTLSAGALYGQDGWVKAGSGTGSLIVGSGASGWNGKYATQPATGVSDTQDYRINNDSWSYSIDPDRAFEVSCLVQAGGNGSKYYYAIGGAQHYDSTATSGNNSLWAGVWNTGIYWAVGGTAYTKAPTGLFSISDDKVFRVGAIVSPTGVSGQYSVQRFYQDVTGNGDIQYEGDPIAISDSGVTGDYAHWNLSDWNVITVRVGGGTATPGGRLDDITIRAVPEPSTFVMVAMGLIGLLAYAWRKRK